MQMQDNDRMNVLYNYVKDHFQGKHLEVISALVAMTVLPFVGILKITNKHLQNSSMTID
jgi:hypothetical protein